jgi:hypothetical protein
VLYIHNAWHDDLVKKKKKIEKEEEENDNA